MFGALIALVLLSGGQIPDDLPYPPGVEPVYTFPKPDVKPLPNFTEKEMIIGEPVEVPPMPTTTFRCVRDPSYQSKEYEVWVCARKKV